MRAGWCKDRRRGDILRERYLHKVRAFPQVRELFKHLRKNGIKVALATSAKEAELTFYKRVAGIDDLVDVETSAEDAEESKPNPDIFEAAVSGLGITSADIVVVGDTPYDVEAAEGAGLKAARLRICKAVLRRREVWHGGGDQL